VSIRRALVLSLGEFGVDRLSVSDREQFIPRLEQIYQQDADPGLHSATEWLLRKWGQEARLKAINRALASLKVEGSRPWRVYPKAGTMMIVPSVGKIIRNDWGQVNQLPPIDRTISIAATKVTIAQFRQFRPKHTMLGPPGDRAEVFRAAVWRNPDCPVTHVSWFDAAAYCNWLNEQEQIPPEQWCYEPNAQGQYDQGMKIKRKYRNLTGYRLPTEQEWEYACRAGSGRRWHCGMEEAQLEKYAWYQRNALGVLHAVGTLKPNDFGFFDMHGNAWEWCQGTLLKDGKWDPDGEEEIVDGKSYRPLHGGSYDDPAVSAAIKTSEIAMGRVVNSCQFGFRPARTIKP
jgi:formylglycine-generating enzyme required for sulfatase activity